LEGLKTERPTGAALRSPFSFDRYGECGMEISELFKHTAKHADDLCVIRSMMADVPNHEPSLMLMNCGEGRLARPSMGSWVTYGLGSENENLPAFVSLCPGGMPIKRAENWRSSFLPGNYQGTYLDSSIEQVDLMIENLRNQFVSLPEQRRQLALIDAAGLPRRWPDLPLPAVLDCLQGDKKVRDGRVRFVLPSAIGAVQIRDDVTAATIAQALAHIAA
jgi:hypothetical protein